LFLNNHPSALEDGRGRLLQHFESENLAPSVVNRLEVIFEEVIVNVITHGFRPLSDQLIFVLAGTSLGAIELIFEDDGMPFNPLTVPPPDRFQSLEAAKIGGLGIHLVTRLSASAHYTRIWPGEAWRPLGDRRFLPNNRLTVAIAR
jgi:anti-sigma regulatory factor (Ser/Thr protein kinase)